VNIAEIDLDLYSNLETLTIFQGTIYFHVFNKLFKIANGSATEILSGDVIRGISTYRDKLIVSGEGLNLSNDKFTVAIYDGVSFQPMSKELVLSRIIPANDKLYFQGFPAFTYDGQGLDSLDFYGYFYAVDAQENIYFGDSYFEDFKMQKKHSDGQIEVIGNVISGFGNPQEVEWYDGTLFVVSAAESAEESSKVYFLNENQKWVQIPTEHFVYDVVIFNNTLLSISLDGKIYELLHKF
jgi:hypothetical protein